MRIFLTGAAGFIGSYLLQRLLLRQEVERVYCLCRRSTVPCSEKTEVIRGRLADLAGIKAEADILVHCAGLQNNYGGRKEEVYEKNMLGMRQVIAFCRLNGIKRIVFFSSINACLQNRSYYSESKREAEELLRQSGLEYSIIRPALVFGRECTGLNYIVDYIKKHYFIPVIGDGEKLEQPVYVEELAYIAEQMILHFQPGRTEKVCGMKAMSYNEMLHEIAGVLGRRIKLVHLPIGPFLLVSRLADRLGLPFPVSEEQIYHLNEDLAADMSEIYEEMDFTPESFAANLRKYAGV